MVIEMVVVGPSDESELCFVARVSAPARIGWKLVVGAFREKFASWSDQETEESLWVEGSWMSK